MPGRSLTVISVKSALYCGLSAASEFCHTPSRPRLGSMYQSVSSAACCRPFDWLPALMAQILNQPAFLMVPSGFSRIRVSLRGRLANKPWAGATSGRIVSPSPPHSTAASNAPFSLIGPPPCCMSAHRPATLRPCARSRDCRARFPRGETLHLAARPQQSKSAAKPARDQPILAALLTGTTIRRSLQRDIVKRVALIGEPGKGPVPGNGELDHGAVHTVGAEIWVEVGKVVEDEITARFDLRRGGNRIPGSACKGMIGVDVDPIEVLIGEADQHLVRLSRVLLNAGIGRHHRVEQGKIEVDEVQFGWITVRQDVPGEIALVGADLGDAPAGRQGLHEVVARGRDAALPHEMGRQRW